MSAIFTTDVITDKLKSEYWHDFVCEHIADLDCRIDDTQNFNGKIISHTLGRIMMSSISADPHFVYRNDDRISRRENDYFLVIYQKSGEAKFEQFGRSVHLSAGDCVIYDPKLTYAMSLLTKFEHVTLRVPRYIFAPLKMDMDSYLGRKIGPDSISGEAVSGLISTIATRMDEADTITLHALIEGVIPFIVQAFISKYSENKHQSTENAGQTLARIKIYILDNINQFDLNLTSIAKETGLSTRQLGRLFKNEGMSPGRWIKSQRLERCAAALVNPAFKGNTITEIAFKFGISDISHFCRSFKETYNLTPSQYRVKFGNHEALELVEG